MTFDLIDHLIHLILILHVPFYTMNVASHLIVFKLLNKTLYHDQARQVVRICHTKS